MNRPWTPARSGRLIARTAPAWRRLNARTCSTNRGSLSTTSCEYTVMAQSGSSPTIDRTLSGTPVSSGSRSTS